MNVNTNKTTIEATRNGIIGFTNLPTDKSETCEATNKFNAIGGVIKPIARFITIIIPKWTGSIPSSIAKGKSIGVKIKIAVDVSINIPKSNKSKFMISISKIVLSVKLVRKLDIVAGTW